MTVKDMNKDWNTHPHHFTTKELLRVRQGLAPWESLSFGCGGWLQFYLFGVAKAIQTCKLDEGVRYYGCSAGALAAAGIVVKGEFDSAIQFCKDHCLPTAYGRSDGLFLLSQYVSECVKANILPNIPAEGIPDNALNVAMTQLPFMKGEMASKFDSTDDIVLSLLASCAAFPLASLVNKQGKWYIDGGITNFQPVEDAKTVTVSALYFSDCDIKPSRYVPLWWSFMPPRCENTVDWLYNLGFEDGLAYFAKRGLHINEEDIKDLRPKKVDHPFDQPRRVSVHRFLGYQWSDFSQYYILSFLADTLLMLFLVVIIKPILLTLIYIELLIRVGFLIVCSLSHSVNMIGKTYYHMLAYFLAFNVSMMQHGTGPMHDPYRQMIQELVDCCTCILSVQLLLRILSRPLPHAVVDKHDRLYKFSIVYRFVRHIL